MNPSIRAGSGEPARNLIIATVKAVSGNAACLRRTFVGATPEATPLMASTTNMRRPLYSHPVARRIRWISFANSQPVRRDGCRWQRSRGATRLFEPIFRNAACNDRRAPIVERARDLSDSVRRRGCGINGWQSTTAPNLGYRNSSLRRIPIARVGGLVGARDVEPRYADSRRDLWAPASVSRRAPVIGDVRCDMGIRLFYGDKDIDGRVIRACTARCRRRLSWWMGMALP